MWDGVDRRKFVRVEYPCLITVHKNTSPPQSILTHTENICVGGVRVIIKNNLETMAEVNLELDLMDTLPTITSKGIIVWVETAPSNPESQALNYDTGIKFTSLEDEYRRRIKKVIDHIMERRS